MMYRTILYNQLKCELINVIVVVKFIPQTSDMYFADIFQLPNSRRFFFVQIDKLFFYCALLNNVDHI